jgi:hypothetical protein
MSALRAKADAACSRCKWLLLTPTGSQAHLRARSYGLARAHDDYRLKPLPDRPLTPVNRSRRDRNALSHYCISSCSFHPDTLRGLLTILESGMGRCLL